jgi:uncharacterized membrane protein
MMVKAGWLAVLLSIVILLVFASMRVADLGAEPPGAADFGIRYVEHRALALWHIVPGLVFLTAAPLQFVRRIRQRHIRLHRRLGWLLAGSAGVSGTFALIANVQFPAYGGVTTQTATVFFGLIFLFSLARAVRAIRRREVERHREWMIRTFALATGVATIRVCQGLFMALSDYRFVDVFGVSFWLGFGINLIAAEIWINHTRPRPFKAGQRVVPVSPT